MATNPLLAELNNLSPAAKTALAQAHAATAQAAPAAPSLIRDPSAQPPVPPLGGANTAQSAPAGNPQLIRPPDSGSTAPIAADQAELQRKENTGSGISQIHSKIENSGFGKSHPLLGKALGWGAQIPAMLADVSASAVAPAITANVPGTEYHHNRLVGEGQRQLGQEVGNAEKQSQAGLQNAQAEEQHQLATSGAAEEPAHVQLLGAQATEEQAKADALKAGKAWKVETSPGGEVLGVTNGVTNYIPGQAGIPPEAQSILDQAAKNHQQQVTQTTRPLSQQDADMRNQMWNPILAKHHLPQNPFTPGMAASDAAQVYSSLNGVMNQGRGDTNVVLKQEGLANQQGKQDTAGRQAIYKTYQPVMDSAERFNVMTKNYEDAIKEHNQQAMLSLLYNHMGMTMGLQKGARMTQDLIREAQQSQPWLQGIKAKFDKDGVLTGVTLSPGQMQQMVGLAQDRYKEDVGKARNEAGYLGATDDGPKRTPGKSTINYYTHLASGDPAKAKQLAADDGWSVQ